MRMMGPLTLVHGLLSRQVERQCENWKDGSVRDGLGIVVTYVTTSTSRYATTGDGSCVYGYSVRLCSRLLLDRSLIVWTRRRGRLLLSLSSTIRSPILRRARARCRIRCRHLMCHATIISAEREVRQRRTYLRGGGKGGWLSTPERVIYIFFSYLRDVWH